jgi:Ca2+/Na+ antiporter
VESLVGFDAENLPVGIDASDRGVPEVALGTIIGASMVAIPFALGLTMLIRLIKLELDISRKGVLLVTLLAVLLAWLLSLDGQLSRLDGGLLLVGFAAILAYLFLGDPTGVGDKGRSGRGDGGAFAVSVEELARTLVPALKGHAEISLGNVVGSATYFSPSTLG